MVIPMKLTSDVIKKISNIKKEPEFILNFRLKCLEAFNRLQNPNFGPKLDIDYHLFSSFIFVEKNYRMSSFHL